MAEKEQAAQNLDAAKRLQQPQVPKRRKPARMSRKRLKIEPREDHFKNHTSRSMKRHLDTRKTGKSKPTLEIPCPGYDSPEHTEGGESVGQESLWSGGPDPAEIKSNETTFQHNSILRGPVPQKGPTVEDAQADKRPRRLARLSVLNGLSHGAPRRNIPPSQ
ncbi:hypothetical protein LTR96_011345 [Exophiala xenobiotica]|nr:hypothetical protein LTR41_011407 [Exophiala xenobiotica]KAK5215416.1 hypothetical protein LTR72_011530 [Exophiala xenobiotica]KAK5263236.1 hypothetical protein LTR96_011345 [Exophiala xenobiotica]KAK5282687.1 hypothetical protein LTR40_002929 [Exophiala xenobiotica]KAK5284987.1 hypothetical protein LTR14_011335 [Exophiala xenobiotica]